MELLFLLSALIALDVLSLWLGADSRHLSGANWW